MTSDDKKYIILMYKLILVGRLQSLRVISGLARGLKLSSIDGMETRPTLDRVKEPLFSMLMPYLNDANVLDLFAGSGALGIEAISRGALKCTFTDKNPKCVKVILDNVKKARMEEKSIVKNISFESFLATSKEKFDLVCFGHTHKFFNLEKNGVTYLNPGSLGAMCENSFAILNIEKNSIKITQIPVAKF